MRPGTASVKDSQEAARRTGPREEVTAYIWSPWPGGQKQRLQPVKGQNSPAVHPEGTKALALPQIHIGAGDTEPVNQCQE